MKGFHLALRVGSDNYYNTFHVFEWRCLFLVSIFPRCFLHYASFLWLFAVAFHLMYILTTCCTVALLCLFLCFASVFVSKVSNPRVFPASNNCHSQVGCFYVGQPFLPVQPATFPFCINHHYHIVSYYLITFNSSSGATPPLFIAVELV